MKTKILSIFLILTLILSIGITGCKKNSSDALNSVNETVSLKPLNISGDKLLWKNPDRGFRTEFVIYVRKNKNKNDDYRTVYVNDSEDQIRADIEKIMDIYNPVGSEQTNLALSYLYITDWHEEELSQELINFFDIYFQVCREKKLKNMLRITYCGDHNDLTTCASETWMIRHIKQLEETGVISRNADAIHTIECGFIGAYGEMGELYQHPPIDDGNVIKQITERLAVPNGLFFSVRRPMYKNLVGADYEHYWSISHNCDAMYGYQDKGWKTFEAGTDEWIQLEKEAAYTPQGGEMHVNASIYNTPWEPIGWEMIMQCYYHRHTSMSFWHGYREAHSGDNVMKRWQTEEITKEMLDKQGIIYDPAWFLDENGNVTWRNIYEFIRDHLGYKVSAKEASISWNANADEKMKVQMSLINYGFSAAFNMESGFAILDKDGKVVSETVAGEPSKWYNRDPDKPFSTDVLQHSISAELNPPTSKGEYKLAFFLRNTMGVYAQLSNECENINGYNILHTFTV